MKGNPSAVLSVRLRFSFVFGPCGAYKTNETRRKQVMLWLLDEALGGVGDKGCKKKNGVDGKKERRKRKWQERICYCQGEDGKARLEGPLEGEGEGSNVALAHPPVPLPSFRPSGLLPSESRGQVQECQQADHSSFHQSVHPSVPLVRSQLSVCLSLCRSLEVSVF